MTGNVKQPSIWQEMAAPIGWSIIAVAACLSLHMLYVKIPGPAAQPDTLIDQVAAWLCFVCMYGGFAILLGGVILGARRADPLQDRASLLLSAKGLGLTGCSFMLAAVYWMFAWTTGRIGAIVVLGQDRTGLVVGLTVILFLLLALIISRVADEGAAEYAS